LQSLHGLLAEELAALEDGRRAAVNRLLASAVVLVLLHEVVPEGHSLVRRNQYWGFV
jgi:hypothetical protein